MFYLLESNSMFVQAWQMNGCNVRPSLTNEQFLVSTFTQAWKNKKPSVTKIIQAW